MQVFDLRCGRDGHDGIFGMYYKYVLVFAMLANADGKGNKEWKGGNGVVFEHIMYLFQIGRAHV